MEINFSNLYSDYKHRKELEHKLSVLRANFENVRYEAITKYRNHEEPTQDLYDRYMSAKQELYIFEVKKVLSGYGERK